MKKYFVRVLNSGNCEIWNDIINGRTYNDAVKKMLDMDVVLMDGDTIMIEDYENDGKEVE